MENPPEQQRIPAYSCILVATPQGLRVEAHGGMTPDLLLAVLWQAIGIVSSQVIQQGLKLVIPVEDLSHHPM